jgi:predicted ATPase
LTLNPTLPPEKSNQPFLRGLRLKRDLVPSFDAYPFSIPAIRHLDRLDLHPSITFLIGENGIGKSTLVEALAAKWGFNPEGGSRNFNFATRASHSQLQSCLMVEKGLRRPTDGYFLRAESFYTLATEIEKLGVEDSYGGTSLHEQSHGEAFLALLKHRLSGNGLYIFDEPEAALSPKRQLSVLVLIHDLIEAGSQFVIATHSPILMAYPGALIYELGTDGIAKVAYEDTDHYRLTRDFLNGLERMLHHLFKEEKEP